MTRGIWNNNQPIMDRVQGWIRRISMELRDLKYFCKVAETQHISKAAKELGVAQPYLTRVIHQLEDELGCELFDHVGRSIQLNDFGRILQQHALAALRELDAAVSELGARMDDPGRDIELITGSSAYCSDIPLRYSEAFPGSNVDRRYMGRKDMIRALENEEADFCICSPPVSEEESSQIISRVVHVEGACLLMPTDHPLAAKDSVTIHDLEGLALITTLKGSDTRNNIDLLCEANGVRPSIVYESIDNNLILRMVEEGKGCTVFAKNYSMMLPKNDRIAIRDFSDQSGDIALCHNRNMQYTNAHKRFELFVVNYFAALE